MEFTRCFRCMEESGSNPCTHCGYDPVRQQGQPYALRPGTILSGKYVVGTPLGQGGFGITYIGWNLALERKVAIKEYFPTGQVSRNVNFTNDLQWYTTNQARAALEQGMVSFQKEARKMARVAGIPQVVDVLDVFEENRTAYIVMDYIAGQTLKDRLKKTGPLSWDQAQDIFLPVIVAMDKVHAKGLIHRDLSPDNLMLLPDGGVKILDLGAAKDLNVNSGASSMQVAKGGFSPLEQYTQRGGSGPWTDVYAMAATIYYSLTGVLPPAAVDRVGNDSLRWDLPQLTSLPAHVQKALKNAMGLLQNQRTQTMAEFLAQLKPRENKPAPRQETKTASRTLPPAQLVLLALAILWALVAGWRFLSRQTKPTQTQKQSQTVSQAEKKYTFPTMPELTPAAETTSPTEPESVAQLLVPRQSIFANYNITLAIGDDGSILYTEGDSSAKDLAAQAAAAWCDQDIARIEAYIGGIIGVTTDGSVLVISKYDTTGKYEIADWQDIVDVHTQLYHTVGLRADGTVVAAGSNAYGQCEVSQWENIVAISSGMYHTVGLRADGTVVSTQVTDEFHDCGQCNISGWTDIVAIEAGDHQTIGLKADGTVVATEITQVRGVTGIDVNQDFSDWTDIVAISSSSYLTAGLKSDGTVLFAGGPTHAYEFDVSDWKDIVAVSASGDHIVGLKADGTLVATGSNYWGQCDIADWTNIRIPKSASERLQ